MRRINPDDPEPKAITWAASIALRGGVIVYPTETFYGLGTRPDQVAAVERIYRIKGRSFQKALPLIAADIDAARSVVKKWPPVAERLACAFWPGPLTLIALASSHLPPLLHAHTGKIAVRASSHPVARALASAIGGVMTATSANIAGEPPSNTPEGISCALLSRVDGVLHGGATVGGLASTIVDVSGETPRLVRAGVFGWPEILEALERNS
jgi:L-threonylcarbamoyladenylate synthase